MNMCISAFVVEYRTSIATAVSWRAFALIIGILYAGFLLPSYGAFGESALPTSAGVGDETTTLADIKAFAHNPLAAHRDGATKRLLEFTEANSQVFVELNARLLPFLTRNPPVENSEVLIGAYIAGNLAPQLESRIKRDHPLDALAAMCAAYREMRTEVRIEEISELESWCKLPRSELLGVVVQATMSPDEEVAKINVLETYTHKPTGYRFAPSLAGAKLKEVRRYEDSRLGESVLYITKSLGHVNFILYDMGVGGITDGPDSSLVKDSFASSVNDINSFANQGFYKRALCTNVDASQFRSKTTMPLFNVAECFIERAETGDKRVSWVLITGSRKHLLKIRYTAPASAESDAREFLIGLVNVFFGSNTLENAGKDKE